MSNTDTYKVCYCYADSATEYNCSHWLAKIKSDAFNAHPSGAYEARLLYLPSILDFRNEEIVRELARYDILIVERNFTDQNVLNFVNYWQGLGKTVCATWDDHYPGLKPDNPAFRFWKLNAMNLDPPPLEMLRRALGMVDGFTSPSKRILEDWREAADDRVYWLPNYAPVAYYTDLPERNNDRLIIGWGGSVSHYDSWHGSGMYEACKRVAARHPDVLFRIHGNDPRIYAHLPVPEKQKELVPGVAPEEWPKRLAQFDIGVAPLHGEYDQRRSWIKGLEYSLAGVPWLGQAGWPYQDLIDALDADEATSGFGKLVGEPVAATLEAGADAWEAALLDAIDNIDDLRRKAAAVRQYALSNWTAEANVEKTAALYQQIALGARGTAILPNIYYVRWPVSPATAVSA